MNDGGPRDQLIPGDCAEVLPLLPASSVHMALCDLPYGVTANAWDCEWFRYEWVWVKSLPTGFLNAQRAPLRQHEAVLVFCERQPPYVPQFRYGGKRTSAARSLGSTNYGIHAGWHYASDGRRYPTTVLEFPHEERGQHHPTAKPVALFRYLIRTYTELGQVVLDPTIGSGTTAVACVHEDRHFIGIERDEAYFATAERRIAEVRAQPHLFAAPSLDAGAVQQKNEMVSLFGNEEGAG